MQKKAKYLTETWLYFLLMISTFLSCSNVKKQRNSSNAIKILSLNIFDQQQGNWSKDFRTARLKILSSKLDEIGDSLKLVFLQESQAKKEGSEYISTDAQYLSKNFSYHHYTHESIEKDGMSYGHLVLSKKKPRKTWKDSFHFQGGSQRVVQFSLWDFKDLRCLGVANLHLSWQSSQARYKEVNFLASKIPELKNHCSRWLFLGDFNADESSDEMKFLFHNGLRDFFTQRKPTVGPFNPIRSIYGKIKNQTIDWILGINIEGKAEVLFNKSVNGIWISDHSAILVELPKQ